MQRTPGALFLAFLRMAAPFLSNPNSFCKFRLIKGKVKQPLDWRLSNLFDSDPIRDKPNLVSQYHGYLKGAPLSTSSLRTKKSAITVGLNRPPGTPGTINHTQKGRSKIRTATPVQARSVIPIETAADASMPTQLALGPSHRTSQCMPSGRARACAGRNTHK